MYEDLIRKIEKLAEEIAAYYGCYIVGIVFSSSSKGGGIILRVYADAEGGVNISQLTDISKELSMILDIEDLIDFKYTLEVSSPGVDRVLFKLNDYIKYRGSRIKILVKNKIGSRLNFIGKLIDVSGGEVNANINIKIFDEIENKILVIPFFNIKKANLMS